jgi:hypothetical protein
VSVCGVNLRTVYSLLTYGMYLAIGRQYIRDGLEHIGNLLQKKHVITGGLHMISACLFRATGKTYLKDKVNKAPKTARPFPSDLGADTEDAKIWRKRLHKDCKLARACSEKPATRTVTRGNTA